MIDSRDQVERLIPRLRDALPLSAKLSPALQAVIREQSPEVDLARGGLITRVDYAGDEGGIMCRLILDEQPEARAYFVSITYLAFDRRQHLSREIAAYQKHRSKRIRTSQQA